MRKINKINELLMGDLSSIKNFDDELFVYRHYFGENPNHWELRTLKGKDILEYIRANSI